jgi:predicted DNA-binding ribbon-helix-helix protein
LDQPPDTLVSRPLHFGCSTVDLMLEVDLWSALDQICEEEKVSLETIISTISDEWLGDELPSALWQYAIAYYRARSGPKREITDSEHSSLLYKVRGGTRQDA